jgi:hypothetical protein
MTPILTCFMVGKGVNNKFSLSTQESGELSFSSYKKREIMKNEKNKVLYKNKICKN